MAEVYSEWREGIDGAKADTHMRGTVRTGTWPEPSCVRRWVWAGHRSEAARRLPRAKSDDLLCCGESISKFSCHLRKRTDEPSRWGTAQQDVDAVASLAVANLETPDGHARMRRGGGAAPLALSRRRQVGFVARARC